MSTDKLRPETTYQAVIGRVIVKCRKGKSIDQGVLANAVGVTQPTWSRIERGESSLSIEQLAKAAELLQVNPSTILIEAEQALEEIKNQGVVVRMSKTDGRESSNGLAIIGAAALGALVGAAIAKTKN